jgi:hypothetical protein
MVHSWNIPKLVQVSKGIPCLFFSHRLWFMGLSRRPAGGSSTILGRDTITKAGIARPPPEPPEPLPSRCALCHKPPLNIFKAELGPPPYRRPEAKAPLGAPHDCHGPKAKASPGIPTCHYTCEQLTLVCTSLRYSYVPTIPAQKTCYC